MTDWTKHVPGPHEIETFTGKYVDLSDPKPESIDLESVAHGLANTCRYNGQVRFYSVAEHAVMVSRRLERKGFPSWVQMAGLHHDDAEAFLGDVTRPLKSLFQPRYEELTAAMDDAIVQSLSLSTGRWALGIPCVKDADNWSLLVEAWNLLPSQGINWSGSAVEWSVDMEAGREEDTDLWLGGLSPEAARILWLNRHFDLCATP